MTKRSVILLLIVCSLVALLSSRTLSQADRSDSDKNASSEKYQRKTEEEIKKEIEHWRNMTDAERKREMARRRAQLKSELEKRRKEREKQGSKYKPPSKAEKEKKYKEYLEEVAESRREFLPEKYALKPTEEQWKIIKPKMEKVRFLRDRARDSVVWTLTSSSGNSSQNGPDWQWVVDWKDKPPAELTEAQKIANELMVLIDKKDTTSEQYRRKIEALRKSRLELAKIKRQYAEAKQELRKVLTTRQEAALVLMGWL
ncbi:MAG: hypothetical protein A2Z25_00495 [Planctomycetes bacterium RBG_16_55_9]|nr:MAG: hypothetical protein A2Z25_00495 [Planctomycetes bacterium RBG_16_55_9]